MLSQFIDKNESLLDKEDGAFLFCLELGKGIIKRNFNQLGIYDYTFINVINAIEELSFERLKQLGLDSVIFTNGSITESKVIDYVVKSELDNIPVGTHPTQIDTILSAHKLYSKYFNVDTKATEVKTVLSNTNFISDIVLVINENVPINTVVSENIILLNMSQYKYELINYTDVFSLVNGRLTTINTIDYETRINYDLQIRIQDKSDATKFWLEIIHIDVVNMPDIINILPIRTFSVDENKSVGTIIGDLKTCFGAEIGLNTSLVLHTYNNKFTISNGNLVVNGTLSFFATPQYVVTVRITNVDVPTMFWDMDVTVNLNNVVPMMSLNFNTSITNNLPIARIYHVSTTLLDGRVLVLGGGTQTYFGTISNNNVVWAAGTPLPQTRNKPSLYTLQDGRILVVGGWNGGTSVPTTHLGTIVGNTITWVTSTPLLRDIGYQAGTMLPDGRVVVHGGVTSMTDRSGTIVKTTYIGTIVGNTINWIESTPTPQPIYFHTLTTLSDGRLLIAGGMTGLGTSFTGATYIGTVNGNNIDWVISNPIPFSRHSHTISLLSDGRILAIGGANPQATTYSHFGKIINNTIVWTEGTRLLEPLVYHSADTIGDKIFLAGGANYNGQQHNKVTVVTLAP